MRVSAGGGIHQIFGRYLKRIILLSPSDPPSLDTSTTTTTYGTEAQHINVVYFTSVG